jgi:carboxyl-terminal processing protease
MKSSWLERCAWLVTGMLLGVGLSAGAAAPFDTLYRKLEVLAEVLGQIENKYVDAVSPTELVYGAAQGAVEQLDGHSAFFSPDEYRDLLDVTEGEYAGIGVEVATRDGVTEVVAVFDHSPAHRAGVRAGDEILAVDGASLEDAGIDLVRAYLRGPAGTRVVLSVRRANRDEPWTTTLVRSWIRIAPVEARSLELGVEYVRIKSFARRVAHDLETQLKRRPPTRGLVLDLRGNPGGLFDEAIAVCDLFLDGGMIVSVTGKGGRVIERHTAHANGTQADYPVAVLIDGGSASAAEIVAGALHDRGRARLFGERSYGKGSVQSILDMSDGSGLKLTVARYVTPSGARIEGLGVAPNEAVEEEEATDAVLAAAQEWLRQ